MTSNRFSSPLRVFLVIAVAGLIVTSTLAMAGPLTVTSERLRAGLAALVPGADDPVAEPVPAADLFGAGEAIARGRVHLDAGGGLTLAAFLSQVELERFENETWSVEASGMTGLGDDPVNDPPNVLELDVYEIAVAGGGAFYRACAFYPAVTERLCSEPLDIFTFREMGDIVLVLEPLSQPQEEVMGLVPNPLNCGGHQAVLTWLSQMATNADCNDWTNDQEIMAGCNPFNPGETPSFPHTCKGPAIGDVDPEDPESVLRLVKGLIPPGLNCGGHQDPSDIVNQTVSNADCNQYTNDQELQSGCNPLNPWSYPGSPFPGACFPMDPTAVPPVDYVNQTEEFVLFQALWAQSYAFLLVHPWVLWFILVILNEAPDPDDPPLPEAPGLPALPGLPGLP